jgi:hypothetical protein
LCSFCNEIELRKSKDHRCTWVENPGEGVPDVFAKIPRGVKGFRKNCLGGSPYCGFYCIFINKYFEICPTSPLPVCIYAKDDLATRVTSLHMSLSLEQRTQKHPREMPPYVSTQSGAKIAALSIV